MTIPDGTPMKAIAAYLYDNFDRPDPDHTGPHVHWAITTGPPPMPENFAIESRPEPLAIGATPDPTDSAENYIHQLTFALANAIAARIADNGWTQTQAAEHLGITQPRISDIITGKTERFGLRHLLQLADRAQIPVTVLIGDDANRRYQDFLFDKGGWPAVGKSGWSTS